ncbi:restriction endonuclease subunit S [Burkholderia glumae]|uniref:restriction endonuclease subunit S n=1 Tax=Burkholderia glumae TaxID=337 RepID=UPI00214F61BF|nr:restriction endonuclease subunit S [Burkholderia glumae]
MSSEWPHKRLGDCCQKIGSGATPKGGKDAYLDHGAFRLIRSQNVYNDGFTPAGLAYIDEEQARKLDGVSVEAGDVLLNITGDSVARVCQAPAQFLPARVNQHVAIIRPRKDVFNAKFLRYFLASPAQQNFMLGLAAAGATRNALTKGMIEDFVVPCPSMEEQAAIAEILGALDDRIAVLHETNATLEAIAQALFKSWFVDFDPVRAKQEGRAPEGMDEGTAALFPDAFEESELGLVPKGWRASTLGKVVAECGGTIQTGPFGSQLHASDYVESGIPVVMPKDIHGRRVVADTIARIRPSDADRLERHKLNVGDVIFSRRGDVERHALIGNREVGWLCGTGCLLVRPGASFVSSTFLSMTLDCPSARRWLVQHAVGATMPNLNTAILGSVPVLIPPNEVLRAVEDVISTTEAQISQNSAMAEVLAELRDTLLPRLISGQLRLPEAEAEALAA